MKKIILVFLAMSFLTAPTYADNPAKRAQAPIISGAGQDAKPPVAPDFCLLQPKEAAKILQLLSMIGTGQGFTLSGAAANIPLAQKLIACAPAQEQQ